MKKRIIALVLAGIMSVAATACGEREIVTTEKTIEIVDNTMDEPEEPTVVEEPAATEPEVTEEPAAEPGVIETPAPTEEPVEEPAENPNAGEVVEENGLRKVPVITNKELNYTGQTGPFSYTIKAIQVSKVTALTDEMAGLLGTEKGQEIALVVMDLSAENQSEDTNDFYIGQTTITTNTKEQVTPDIWLSDYIESEFFGNVIHSGTMYWILHNTNADDITTITLHADAPNNSNFETIGDEVNVELNFSE